MALLALAFAAGCATGESGGRPTDGGATAGIGMATPEASISPQVAATVTALRARLTPAGLAIDQVNQPYRPSEPPTLTGVRRAVFRCRLGDPDDGYVVIYETTDPTRAAALGREFADHVESGFGQTNYPLDAQFSLAQVGGTLVFTWWSRSRSSDPERARAAFEAVAAVGQPIEIRK